jgi:voltage-gated sodium channel
MAQRLDRIASSSRFQNTIMAVIVLNAITLGLGTFGGINRKIGSELTTLDEIFLGIFVVELAIRIGAYGRRPQDFFKEGWNVFDFIVIGAAFAPGLRENATLLRLARLLRVVRLVSVLPDLRVLIRGMVASIAPIGSLAALAVLVMYVYGMVGWILFHEGDPENWGTIADAMLTLFVVMTLESWPDIMGSAMEVTSWAWVYFVSYVLVASFLIINVVIAIIISAVEEAHQEERRELLEGDPEGAAADHPLDSTAVRARITALREALEALERDVGGGIGPDGAGARRSRVSKARLKP